MTLIATGGAARCGATTKANQPCGQVPVSGKAVCAFHDPETRAKAQKAGGEATAKERKPLYLSREEADAIIHLRSREDIPGTIEAIARRVASADLNTWAGNAVLIAASAAIKSLESNDSWAKRRAEAMSDLELEEAITRDYEERRRREMRQ